MDGAVASNLYQTVGAELFLVNQAPTSRRVAPVSFEAFCVSRRGAAGGADLGGSSKYSNENFED